MLELKSMTTPSESKAAVQPTSSVVAHLKPGPAPVV
jgi:hypothetical protein